MTTKSMTVAEAGRLGGEKVKATRGREFFVEIGKKGGRAAKATGLDYVAMGKKGGRANIEKNGLESVRAAGMKGGARVAALLRAGRAAAAAAANEEDAIDAVVAGVSR